MEGWRGPGAALGWGRGQAHLNGDRSFPPGKDCPMGSAREACHLGPSLYDAGKDVLIRTLALGRRTWAQAEASREIGSGSGSGS